MENIFNIINSTISLLGIPSIAIIFYFVVNFFAQKFNFTPNKIDKIAIAIFSINFSILIILTILAIYDINFIFELSIKTNILDLTYLYLLLNLLFILITSIFYFTQGINQNFIFLMLFFIFLFNFSIFKFLQQNTLNEYFKDDYQTYLDKKIDLLFNNDKDKAIELSKKFVEILEKDKPLNDEQQEVYKKLNLNLAHEFMKNNKLKESIEYYQKALDLKVSEISQKIEEKLNVKYYKLFNNNLKSEIFLANDEAIGLFKTQEYKKALVKYREALNEFMIDNEISQNILTQKYDFNSFKPIIANLEDRDSFVKLNFNIAHTYFELKDFNNSYKYFDLALLGAYNNSSTKYLTSICQGILNNKEYIKDINFTTDEGKKIFKYLYQKEKEHNLTKDLKLIQKKNSELKYSQKDNILESIELDIYKAQKYFENRDFENALKFYNNALIVALEHNIHYVIYIHNKIALINKILEKFEEAISEYKLVEFYLKDLNIDSKNFYSSNQREYLEKRKVEKMEKEKVILEIESNLNKFSNIANILMDILIKSKIASAVGYEYLPTNKIIKINNKFYVFVDFIIKYTNNEKFKIATIMKLEKKELLTNDIKVINDIDILKKINDLLFLSFKQIKYQLDKYEFDKTHIYYLHQSAIKINEASKSMKFMDEVRNKAVNVYKEILKTKF